MGLWGSAKAEAAPAIPAAMPADAHHLTLLLRNYENSQQGWFWSTNADGRLTYLSEAVARDLTQAGAPALSGARLIDVFTKGDEAAGAARSLPFVLTKQARFDGLAVRAAASEERWWALSGAPFLDAAGQFAGYRGHGVDVTEHRRSSEHAAQLAMIDPLTGLPNRLRMGQVLETKLLAAELQKRACAVILIDLDRFKQVNDTLGHPAGDALLRQVAGRLQRMVGDRGDVFRLGGDEFQVIVQDCDDRGLLGDLCGALIDSVSEPYSIDGSRCIIGASVGIAISPFDARAKDELIQNADLALYAAKDGGRGRFRFYSGDMTEAATKRRILEEDMRDALAAGEFSIAYQPIVDARSNVIIGVEALVRWTHGSLGPISPALFIPIAEEAGLIAPIGEWVLRRACDDAAQWPGALRVAVNVSPIQFAQDGFSTVVMQTLAATGLAPERLELEITEGVFLGQSSETDRIFAALKDLGVRLALDDFGTGYSSLAYLRTAPFDKIKIDQSFVREATLPGSRNRAIIAAIVALAEAVGMDTTAEGIESHDQLDLVRSLRVGQVQGYIYSKPLDDAALRARLGDGDLAIRPVGPARQRSQRNSMYRKLGAIVGNRYLPVLMRNLSESGALIEGLGDAAVGVPLILDFGEGQLAYARVRRARNKQHGIQFEHPLVPDGGGGFCTSRRVSAYHMRQIGVPASPAVSASLAGDIADDTPGGLRARLGNAAPPPVALSFADIASHYLDSIRDDPQKSKVDGALLHTVILPRFGALRPEEVTPAIVAAWLEDQVGAGNLSPNELGEVQAIFAQLYMLAIQCGMLGGTDAAGRELAILNAIQSNERRLTSAEVERLQRAAAGSSNVQLRVIVPLLMLTNSRLRELLDARWDHIDVDAAIWRIPGGAYGKGRSVTLSAAACAIIRRLPRWPDCMHLIVNPTTRRPYRSFAESWNTVRVRAGLADLELDDLRHCLGGGAIVREQPCSAA